MSSASFQQDVLMKLSEYSPVYLVGGAVRDAQLGIPSNDVDAVTCLSLEDISKKLTAWGYKPHVMGAKLQTVSVYHGSARVDLVSFDGELKIDALHRDFTLNALYQDVRTGEIIDPLNGLNDLKTGMLKACGSAIERFKEDPLRILRLVRLAVKNNFEVEPQTWQAAVDLLPLISDVSVERVTEELGKIFILAEIDKALGLLDDLGYFTTFIPELARLKGLVQNRYHTKDAWEHTRHVVKNTPPKILLRLAALFHDLGKWETASQECYTWGSLQVTTQGYEVNDFKLIGKNLERWKNQVVEVHGGRLDNYPNTIIIKRIKPMRTKPEKSFVWVPEGKRHFLQHEKESARLVKTLLPRFRWSMVLPGGRRGERELCFLVGHHMMGTMTFMNDLREKVSETKMHSKARRFAWEIGWDGQSFETQRVENLLDLWRADFLGGKHHEENLLGQLDRIQSVIRISCDLLKVRAKSLDWKFFEEFVHAKGLEGEGFGRFKEQVRWQVMMDSKNSLTDSQFLNKEYGHFRKASET